MKKKLYCIVLVLFFTIDYSNANSYAWSKMADFGGGVRDAAFGFSIGNYGYAGTGRNPNDMDDLWQYDPSNNTWSQKANYPGQGRYGLFSFAIGNFGYAGTGWSGTGGGGNQYSDFWRYDPVINSWQNRTDFPGGPRYTAVSFTIGNKGYAGLGYSPLYQDMWEYDPAADSWTQKADFPHPRLGCVGFGIGNKGYVGMGYSLLPASFNDLYEFDPTANTWTQKSSAPCMTRRAPVSFIIGNFAYVGMGYNDTTYLTDFYRYDAGNNQWTTVASIGGIPRYWSFGFSIANYGYVGTGSFAGITNPLRTADFWRFEECDGSALGIGTNPFQNNSIDFTISSDRNKSLYVTYDLSNQQNVVLNIFNALGELVVSTDLKPGKRTMSIPTQLSSAVYYYTVSNNELRLSSGKVVVN